MTVTITCVDASAILRLLFAEGDFSLVEKALLGPCVSSVLATLEVPCAIEARVHRGELAVADRLNMLAQARKTLDGISQSGLTERVRRETLEVAARFPVRTADAVYVATAAVLNRQQARRGGTLRFCTADRRQAHAARTLFGDEQVDYLPPLATEGG